jgi:hypothetical protein
MVEVEVEVASGAAVSGSREWWQGYGTLECTDGGGVSVIDKRGGWRRRATQRAAAFALYRCSNAHCWIRGRLGALRLPLL